MWFNQKSSYFLDTFGNRSRYLSKLISGNSGGHSCIEAFLRVKLLQYNQVRIIVLSIYNDIVTPDMKINSLNCFMVHPSTPYYSGTPFENFGIPLGVQYTRLKSTDLD